jgi:hypothetical protein
MHNIKKSGAIYLIAVIAFLMAILSVGCGNDDKGTNSLTFSPGKFKGVYRITLASQTPDEVIYVNTMEFRFGDDDTIRTIYTDEDTNQYICTAKGGYTYSGDSLKIVIPEIFRNLQADICNPDLCPEGKYMTLPDDHYIIFKATNADTVRRIELWQKIS